MKGLVFHYYRNILHPHEQPCCIQACRELTTEDQEQEISGILEAMEFFDQKKGIILTFNTEDTIFTSEKKINVIPVWKWGYEEMEQGYTLCV
jgi:predicted AAA+ superfamily ATPase